MSGHLIWQRDGCDWPNREASEFVSVSGMRWHVQRMGSGPGLLLVHGTGAATHSWRELMPLLAKHFSVIAPDLPGHGFSTVPSSYTLSLPGMARLLNALLQTLEVKPTLVFGHSAGAAILARMTLDHLISPRLLFSINGALFPPHGFAGHFFSPAAKLLANSSLVPKLFAWRASDRTAVERLIRSTGSQIDAQGIEFYTRLVSNSAHVSSVLSMMANWDLNPLIRDLAGLSVPLVLLIGDADRTIPAAQAEKIRALVPSARIKHLSGLGHLAHEEQPQLIADCVMDIARASDLCFA